MSLSDVQSMKYRIGQVIVFNFLDKGGQRGCDTLHQQALVPRIEVDASGGQQHFAGVGHPYYADLQAASQYVEIRFA
jgi:hypothetical protein